MQMTFDEYYGNLPVSTLILVRRFNVSPADLDIALDILGNGTWQDVNDHIINNSPNGYYSPRYY